MTTPLGQLAYATPKLLEAKGVPEARRTPEALLAEPPKQLLTSVNELAGGWRLAGVQALPARARCGRAEKRQKGLFLFIAIYG